MIMEKLLPSPTARRRVSSVYLMFSLFAALLWVIFVFRLGCLDAALLDALVSPVSRHFDV